MEYNLKMQDQIKSRRIGFEITLGAKIGNGINSKVRIGYIDGKEYAIKYSKVLPARPREKLHKMLENEVTVLESLKHTNIIEVKGHGYNGHYVKEYTSTIKEYEVIYCILERAKTGNLIDIVNLAGPINEKIARYYFKQLLCAVKFMHNSDYAHTNLTLNNIILDKDLNLKLCGFRHAKQISAISKENEEMMTRPTAMSPQSLLSKKCNPIQDDLFALGFLLFNILYNKTPYTSASGRDPKYRLIYEHRFEEFWSKFDDVEISQEAKDLISSMLAFEPALRLSLCEIEAHPWIEGDVPSAAEIKQVLEAKLEKTDLALREEAKIKKAKKIANKKTRASYGMTSGIEAHSCTRAVSCCYSKQLSYPKKQLENYSKETVAPTHIYISDCPEIIEETLIAYLISSAKEYKVEDKSYRVIRNNNSN